MEEQEHAHPRYILIWVILAVLTAAEVGYAFLDLPKVVLAVGLIFMAVWKAVMVAMYYMHLRYEPARLWIMAISPLPFGVILVLLVITEFGFLR
jgi:cytochrome c oxidase subunit 4